MNDRHYKRNADNELPKKDKKIRRDKNGGKKKIFPDTNSGNENKRNRKLGKE
jgi:hypothetical protein